MGPPGVDTQEHAAQVAAKYRLINLDVDQLCKDWIRRRVDDDYATELRFKIIDGEQIPDDFVMNLVKQRLSMPDCKTNGWILQGAPTSDEQIEYLKQIDQQPNLFVTLEMSDHLIYEKLEQRRFDPLTNKYHYVLNENITDEKHLSRLEHKEEDQHP